MARERWRVIKSFDNYQVSSKGRVRNRKTNKVLRTMSSERGGYYPFVDLRQDGRRACTNVHKLVAITFLGPIPKDNEIHHIDHDRHNNNVENLEYQHKDIHRKNHIDERHREGCEKP